MLRLIRRFASCFIFIFFCSFQLFSIRLEHVLNQYQTGPLQAVFVSPAIEDIKAVFDGFIEFHESEDCPFSCNALWKIERPVKGCDIDFKKRKVLLSSSFIYPYPYVQKAAIEQKAQVCFVGDIHGCVGSLVNIFKRMVKDHILDSNFHIISPTTRIIFLGDYSDRGFWGLETLMLLVLFKLENFRNVFLLRGNHECCALNSMNDRVKSDVLEWEIQQKFGKNEKSEQLFFRILQFYEYLPVALFLISGGSCLQCCHGGIEPSYQLAGFLADYQFTFDFIDVSSLSLGFLWNDFASGDHFHGISIFNLSRGFGYYYDVGAICKYFEDVNALLNRFEVPFTLKGIVRAHQHTYQSLKMIPFREDEREKDFGETIKYWKNVVGDVQSFKIADYIPVYSLSTFYESNGYSYCALDINGDFENWVLTPVEG